MRVQHASPAGTYAHTVNRNWYSDADMPAQALMEGCQDIAAQLISNMDIDVRPDGEWELGRGLGHPQPEPWGLAGALGALGVGVKG